MANGNSMDHLILQKEELENKINELSSENNLSDFEEDYLKEMETELDQITAQINQEPV